MNTQRRRGRDGQVVQRLPQHGLRRAPRRIVGRQRVEPVLGDVEEHRREVHRAEVEQRVERAVELRAPRSRARMRADAARRGASREGAVDARSAARAGSACARVEVARGCRAGSGRCSAPCGRRRRRAAGSRRRPARRCASRWPAPTSARRRRRSCAITVERRDHVAERLVHGAALGVEHPAVREHVGVGRARRSSADADHERGVEPAAVLVGALEVDDAAALGAARAQASSSSGCVTRTARWVEPESNHTSRMSVSLRNGPGGAAAPGRRSPRGRKRSTGRSYQASEPCSRVSSAARAHDARDRAIGVAARLAVDGGDADAPGALARQAPVGPQPRTDSRMRFCDARRVPAHALLDRLERAVAVAVVVDDHEPLVGGAEDHRLVAAPAVRVGVGEASPRRAAGRARAASAMMSSLTSSTLRPDERLGARR